MAFQESRFMNNRPNLYLLGAAKCGTTTLASWLGRHPDVYLIYNKESTFWSRDNYRGWEWYERQHLRNYFGEKYTLDATAINLMLGFNSTRISMSNDDIKYIVLIREPFARAYSHWSMMNSWRPGRVKSDFIDAMIDCFRNYKIDPYPTEAEYVPYMEPKGELYINPFIDGSMYANNILRYKDYKNFIVIPTSQIRNRFNDLLSELELDPLDASKFGNRNVGIERLQIDPQIIRGQSPEMSCLYAMFERQGKILSEIYNYDFLADWGYE
jgi:hypothetical protein